MAFETESSLGDVTTAPPQSAAGVLRFRALLIGVPLVVAVCMLSVFADLITKSIQVGVMQIAPPAVAILFVLVLGNLLSKKLVKRDILNSSDLIIIYGMLTVAVLVSTRGMMEKLIPPLAYLPYYATPANKLNILITQHMPAWTLPFSPAIATGNIPPEIQQYFEGLKAGGSIPWSFWVGPVFAWFTLIAMTIWVFACLATLLRRQWMDHEQLRFPLTILPLSMIQDEAEGEPFFSNKLMWLGFGAVCALYLVNGLHANYPDWPKFVLSLRIDNLFSERPWDSVGPITLFISFAAVGMAYFLPTDLLFSIWFFFLITRYQDVLTVQFGGMPTKIKSHDANVWNAYQAAGAYLVIVAAQVRIGWPYYKQVWQTAWARTAAAKMLDDSDEMMSYRMALFGLLIGFAGIILWLAVAGMNPIIAALQMGIYIFLITMIMTRAVSECGWMETETSFLPSHLISLIYPLHGLGADTNSLIGFTNAIFCRDMRGTLLSPLMDLQKLAKETGTRFRSLSFPLLMGFLVSFVTAAMFFIYLGYSHGALSFYQNPNNNAKNMINFSANDIKGTGWVADSTAYGGFAVGIVATVWMLIMRSHFDWFPLNPLAYAIVPAWTGYVLWFSFFLAWLLKGSILKFGGINTYRKIAPLMIGMVLGDFMMQVFWTLVMMIAKGWSGPSFQ